MTFLNITSCSVPNMSDSIDSPTEKSQESPKCTQQSGAGRCINKSSFLNWFNTLEYDPERDIRVEMELREAKLRNITGKTRTHKGNRVETKYLKIPERYQPVNTRSTRIQAQDLSKKSSKSFTKSKPSYKPGKLPRVATLKSISTSKARGDDVHVERQKKHFATGDTDNSKHNTLCEVKQGYQFWRDCSLQRAIQKAKVEFVPTLVFDMSQRIIRWVCFGEVTEEFHGVKDLAPFYATIIQSLGHFGNSPLVRARSFEAMGAPDEFVLTKNDLVLCLERLCKMFSAAPEKSPAGLVLLQAVVPASFGRLQRLAGSRCARKLAKHCSISDIEGHLVIEEYAGSSGAKVVREIVSDIRSYRLLSSAYTSAKVRQIALKTRQVAQEGHKSESEKLREQLNWCIGDVHSSASLDQLRQVSPLERRALVYKLVLSYRTGLNNSAQLAEALPEKMKSRMYETVKVCEICFDKLTALEKLRVDTEEARRVEAREARQRSKLEKLGRRIARQAAELSRLRLRARRQQQQQDLAMEQFNDQKQSKVDSEFDKSSQELLLPAKSRAENGRKSGIIHKTKINESKRNETRLNEEKCEGADLDDIESIAQYGNSLSSESRLSIREKLDDDILKENPEDFISPTDQASETRGNQVCNEVASKDSNWVSFEDISCASFFGNEVDKLSLCQGIMETLRSGKDARVLAPLKANNDSAEEARLVLRSLYLEFRGMCIDQGYFPDVPIQEAQAMMVLQPLPSYVEYAATQGKR